MRRRIGLLAIIVVLPAVLPLAATAQRSDGEVLIVDSFESGQETPEGWEKSAPVPGVEYIYDRRIASDGSRSLSLQKTANRFFPIASWSRSFSHESRMPMLNVAAKVKASRVTKAVVDISFFDENDQSIGHQWAVYIGQEQPRDPVATHDWKTYQGAAAIPDGTQKIGIALQIYGPGKVWFDQLEARYVDAAEADGTSPQPPERASADPPDAPAIPDPIVVQTSSGEYARYLLIPPADGAPEPAEGYPVLVVLPGGSGTAEFHPFVRRIHEEALEGRFIIAQPVAPPQVVWPTAWSRVLRPTTEEAIAAVVKDVSKRHAVDRREVYALAWSSSGPAAYAGLLQEGSPLAGAFIAMSVFKPKQLRSVVGAAGRRIYLLHSPEDSVCPYEMAADAQRRLTTAGAEVKLTDYAGGHGWHGHVYDHIRQGIEWLQQDGRR